MRKKDLTYLVIGLLVCFIALISCGNHRPSPEEQKKIEELKMELNNVENEISEAEAKDAIYSGGLIKALIAARIEVLKTNRALLEQRINALESGAKITIETYGTKLDLEGASQILVEIEKQTKELDKAKQEAKKYSGGLVLAMKESAIATQEQTIAMLMQRYLILKYGLGFPKSPEAGDSEIDSEIGELTQESSDVKSKYAIADEIISVTLLNKKFTEQDYQEYIFFDIDFKAIGLDKPSRAIKGSLNIQDLFGETKLRIEWTIDRPMSPGEKIIERGRGFEFNQFISEHKWVRSTRLQNMRATFTVTNIIYQDGTRQDF